MRVWLDDRRPLPDPEEWVWVRTPAEVIELLESGKVSELSLDHDLGLDDGASERSGYTVLLWHECGGRNRPLVSAAAGELRSQRQPGRAGADGAGPPHDPAAPAMGRRPGRDVSPARSHLVAFSRVGNEMGYRATRARGSMGDIAPTGTSC